MLKNDLKYKLDVLNGINQPNKLSLILLNSITYEYNLHIEPFSTGFGHTIGNALRRVLLSYIPGSAITTVEIDGIIHEYNNKAGIKEDVLDILSNIQKINIKMVNKKKAIIKLKENKIGKITAQCLIYDKSIINIINPDNYICEITDKNTELNMILTVENGIGYKKVNYYNPPINSTINISKNNILNKNIIFKSKFIDPKLNKENEIGKLFLDVNFNPIKEVNYTVLPARKANYTGLDKLFFYIKTNGTIDLKEIISYASTILINQFIKIKNIIDKDININKDIDKNKYIDLDIDKNIDINKDIDIDIKKDIDKNIDINKDINNNIDKNIDINKDINNNMDKNIDINKDINNNIDKNIDINKDIDKNIDINKDINNNIDKNIDINKDIDKNIDINKDINNNIDKNIDINKDINNNMDKNIDINKDINNNIDKNIDINKDIDKNKEGNLKNIKNFSPNKNPILLECIDILDLSVRAYNCLKNINIYYIGTLVQFDKSELLLIPNLGIKSINQINNILANHGLSLEMKIPNWPPKELNIPLDLKQKIIAKLKNNIINNIK